jgi:hypothetical protein
MIILGTTFSRGSENEFIQPTHHADVIISGEDVEVEGNLFIGCFFESPDTGLLDVLFILRKRTGFMKKGSARFASVMPFTIPVADEPVGEALVFLVERSAQMIAIEAGILCHDSSPKSITGLYHESWE